MSRAQNTERSFTQRTSGVIKKANEVKNRFPNVKISVYIFDGTDTVVYQSDDSWPPAMQETVREIKAGEGKRKRKQLIYCPTDFITVSDIIRYGTNCRPSEQAIQGSPGLDQDPVSCSTLDSASLAVLEQIAPAISHPIAELIPTEHSTPSPPPQKRARMVTRSTTARKHQWNKYGFMEGKTGGEASQE
ncbi:MAG: hypothetical protein M1839_001662 [Geoglossum umbratile]|nr:MAG: hypothetical protein M1839_001662 [Geoglossum umbratile]